MSEQEIRINFSRNLQHLRKLKGLNQNDLAQIFNYSNKAISKWETGETIPDITILKMIADYFKISVDELISDTDFSQRKKAHKRHLLIMFLSAGLSYLLAAIVFLFLIIFEVPHAAYSFLFAIPISAIVLIVFSRIWFNKVYLFISIFVLIWSLFAIGMIFISDLFMPLLIICLILTILFSVFLKIEKKH